MTQIGDRQVEHFQGLDGYESLPAETSVKPKDEQLH